MMNILDFFEENNSDYFVILNDKDYLELDYNNKLEKE